MDGKVSRWRSLTTNSKRQMRLSKFRFELRSIILKICAQIFALSHVDDDDDMVTCQMSTSCCRLQTPTSTWSHPWKNNLFKHVFSWTRRQTTNRRHAGPQADCYKMAGAQDRIHCNMSKTMWAQKSCRRLPVVFLKDQTETCGLNGCEGQVTHFAAIGSYGLVKLFYNVYSILALTDAPCNSASNCVIRSCFLSIRWSEPTSY